MQQFYVTATIRFASSLTVVLLRDGQSPRHTMHDAPHEKAHKAIETALLRHDGIARVVMSRYGMVIDFVAPIVTKSAVFAIVLETLANLRQTHQLFPHKAEDIPVPRLVQEL